MIKQIIENRWLEARGVIAFYPANSTDHDDIELYKDEDRTDTVATLHTLR